MKLGYRYFSGLILSAVISLSCVGFNESAKAEQINIRIASGHPPTVVYAGLMKSYFQTELKKAVEAKTSHKIKLRVCKME